MTWFIARVMDRFNHLTLGELNTLNWHLHVNNEWMFVSKGRAILDLVDLVGYGFCMGFESYNLEGPSGCLAVWDCAYDKSFC